MKKIQDNFGFYMILTDPVVGYERLAELAVKHEVAFLQLRHKKGSTEEVKTIALRLRAIVRDSLTRLIINDYPEVAKEIKADGVHLGQNDMPYTKARALLGKEMIIGISTHNPEQTKEACALGADYIGIGPVFETPTKTIPDPVLGFDRMQQMLRLATVPAVVIGGITLNNLAEVISRGAKNFCLVRPVTMNPEPERIVKTLAGIKVKT